MSTVRVCFASGWLFWKVVSTCESKQEKAVQNVLVWDFIDVQESPLRLSLFNPWLDSFIKVSRHSNLPLPRLIAHDKANHAITNFLLIESTKLGKSQKQVQVTSVLFAVLSVVRSSSFSYWMISIDHNGMEFKFVSAISFLLWASRCMNTIQQIKINWVRVKMKVKSGLSEKLIISLSPLGHETDGIL